MSAKRSIALLGTLGVGLLLAWWLARPSGPSRPEPPPVVVPRPDVPAVLPIAKVDVAPPTGDALIEAVTDMDNPKRRELATLGLSGKRTAGEIQALSVYLTERPVGGAAHWTREFAHRDVLMNTLRAQSQNRDHVISTFARVYQNPRQGDTLRGYALQHLALLYRDASRELTQGQREQILVTLRGALPERADGTLASTALVGLQEIASIDSTGVSSDEVSSLALELMRDPSANALTRISALQIAGENKLGAAEADARRLADDPAQDRVVRMAAIWTLGQLGAGGAARQRLTNDPDPFIRGAASASLARTKDIAL